MPENASEPVIAESTLSAPGELRKRVFRRILRHFEIDEAVAYLLLTRVWQIAAYPVSMLLIVRHLNAETQGFYYTFGSLLALQIFVELGFVIVITNAASHEWASLKLDGSGYIVGSPEVLSRLVSLGRLMFKWYAAAMALFIVGVGIAGWFFLSRQSHPGISWQSPWFGLVVLSGLLFWLLPFNALLEGCNQVNTINRFRLQQAIMENIAFWMTLVLGGGLWAAVAAVGAKLTRNAWLLFVQYKHFFVPFFSRPRHSTIEWKKELLPMQWRLAVSGLVTYLFSSMFNPVMFYYHGAIVAGQMGMTLQIAQGLQMVGMAWLSPKVPQFGICIARREYGLLDLIWRRVSARSVTVVALGTIAIWCAVIIVNRADCTFAHRLLGPTPTALFLFAFLLLQVTQCFVSYLRAHKKEPILVASVTTSVLAGFLIWYFGKRFGAVGAAASYLAMAFLMLVWCQGIWRRCRSAWHQCP